MTWGYGDLGIEGFWNQGFIFEGIRILEFGDLGILNLVIGN